MDIWDKLYNEALSVQNARVVSPFIEAGGVAAAIESESGNIYVGVCIDTCSTLGICAERNAIFNMITNGEHEIDKVLCIMPDGSVGGGQGPHAVKGTVHQTVAVNDHQMHRNSSFWSLYLIIIPRFA